MTTSSHTRSRQVAGLIVVGICFIAFVESAVAQHAYFSFNAGYSLSSGTQMLGRNTTSDNSSTSYEGVYGSLGEGTKFGGSFGYMVSENFGIEFMAGYWMGKAFEITSKSTSGQSTSTHVAKMSGGGIVLAPSFVVAAGTKGANPYARLGGVIGFLKTKVEESNTSSVPNSVKTEVTEEETGNMAIGFVGGLGVEFGAGNAVSFFLEATLMSVTYAPSQLELTKYTENGVDKLSLITTKKYDYKDSYKSTDQHVMQAPRRPFSSLGGAAGIRINLN